MNDDGNYNSHPPLFLFLFLSSCFTFHNNIIPHVMPLKQISEKDCWFVIGAHQAGATERQCSELSGLSKTITHNIITNFKKMGSPHASNMSSVNALMNSKVYVWIVEINERQCSSSLYRH